MRHAIASMGRQTTRLRFMNADIQPRLSLV